MIYILGNFELGFTKRKIKLIVKVFTEGYFQNCFGVVKISSKYVESV